MKPDGERSLWREVGTDGRRVALPFLAIGTVVVLLGLLVTRLLDGTGAEQADAAAGRWFAANRTPTGITLTRFGTLFGETPTIVALTAVTAGIFRVVYRRWRESVLLVFCVVAQRSSS